MLKLYSDGGIIGRNPSILGGTWAWCLVHDNDLIDFGSGYITPCGMETDKVTNNQTELLAMVKGLQLLNARDTVSVYSDSLVTLLRVFKGSSLNNIPGWLMRDLRREQERLENFAKFKWTLLSGHPTKAEFKCGKGKTGHPVSRWNKWADKECGARAREFMREHEKAKSL